MLSVLKLTYTYIHK